MGQCPNKEGCPHLGFASCREILDERDRLTRQVEYKDRLLRLAAEEIEKLKAEVDKLKGQKQYLEAKLKRRLSQDFGISKKHQDPDDTEQPIAGNDDEEPKRKRGAPKGHRGATRKKPEHVDHVVDVYPTRCPICGNANLTPAREVAEHIQEDIVIPLAAVTRFRHHHAYCPACKKVISGFSEEEQKWAYIGPAAKATAGFLRYGAKLSYGTVRKIMKGLFGLDVTESALVGFDNALCDKGLPLYDALKDKLRFSEISYTDETGWRKGAQRMWLWCFTNPEIAVYHIDESRGSKVPKAFLGDEYPGIIVSDFFSAYGPLKAGGKAKCAAHLMRTARDLMRDLPQDAPVQAFCGKLIEIMKCGIEAHKEFLANRIGREELGGRKKQISKKIGELAQAEQQNKETENLRRRIAKHHDEILTFLHNPKVEPTNNRAERQLRPNVIMRKLTFGNRSDRGIKNHALIMSLVETAKLNGRDPRNLLLSLENHGASPESLAMMLGSAEARSP